MCARLHVLRRQSCWKPCCGSLHVDLSIRGSVRPAGELEARERYLRIDTHKGSWQYMTRHMPATAAHLQVSVCELFEL